MLGLGNLSDGLLNAAEKVEGLNNTLKAKKDAVKEAVNDKINDAKIAVDDAKDAVSDAKDAVSDAKDNVATAVKNAARNHLKSTVEQINKNA